MARPVVTLYRRPQCPLCDRCGRLLERLAATMAFDVREIDIEGDEELHRRYLFEIPVVSVGGRTVAWGRIVAVELEEGLRAAFAAAPSD